MRRSANPFVSGRPSPALEQIGIGKAAQRGRPRDRNPPRRRSPIDRQLQIVRRVPPGRPARRTVGRAAGRQVPAGPRAGTSVRGKVRSTSMPRLAASVAQRRPGRSNERGEIEPRACPAARRMNLRGEIEIVDRRQKHPRLAHDLRRALAIAAVRGPEILAFDDLGKADDRVQRSLDLVHQLAQRIRDRRARRDAFPAAAARCRRLTQGDPAVAGKAPVGRIECGNAADLPFAGDGAVCRRRVIDASRNGARMANARVTSSVDAVAVALLRRAIERPISGPRGAPSTQAISPPGPHSQRNSAADSRGRRRPAARGGCADSPARSRRRRSIRSTTS